jgi:hypothetical protein
LNSGYYFGKYLDKVLPGKIYLSLRPQFAQNHDNQGIVFHDAGSRAGFFYYYQFKNEMELVFQYEAGVDFSGKTKFINVSNISDSNRRLSYLSLSYQHSLVLLGKYWSPYYDIAGFTDHYMAFGSQASGAFNNGTDGSSSGTGRPDEVIQLRTEQHAYKVALQIQAKHNEQKNVNKKYQYGVAGSLIYAGWSDISVGASIVYHKFDALTPAMREANINGNDQSYIIGVTYTKDKISTHAVLSYTKNHMTDDNSTYFNGVGSELYVRYNIDESYRLAFGGNVLIPTDNSYKGDYSIKTLIVSLQYTFGEKNFDDLVYLEVSRPFGKLANGDKSKSRIAVGLRYLLQR